MVLKLYSGCSLHTLHDKCHVTQMLGENTWRVPPTALVWTGQFKVLAGTNKGNNLAQAAVVWAGKFKVLTRSKKTT